MAASLHPTRWQSAILARLRTHGRSPITALARELGVSGETVRRHLRPLVEDGVVVRLHGAVALPEIAEEPPFSRRMLEREAEKRAIAKLAADQVEDGWTLMIDAGSTTAHVAEALLARRDLTVVTTSPVIATTLLGRRGHKVYLAGGELRAEIGAAVGPEALALIREFRADAAILSIGGIDPEAGLMDFDLDESRIARAMIDAAARTFVVADRTKHGTRARVRVCGLESIDELLTDAPPPRALAEPLAVAGVVVRIASPADSA
jgi:DeoR family glycerol-3-phosphate regulon repressor